MHKITATSKYPTHNFKELLLLMEAAWKEKKGYLDLNNKSANTLIGLWAINESFDY